MNATLVFRSGTQRMRRSGSKPMSAAEATAWVPVRCPYCGEPFETLVDLSAGSATYVEDCQVCCQPIEMSCEVDDAGGLAAFRALRLD